MEKHKGALILFHPVAVIKWDFLSDFQTVCSTHTHMHFYLYNGGKHAILYLLPAFWENQENAIVSELCKLLLSDIIHPKDKLCYWNTLQPLNLEFFQYSKCQVENAFHFLYSSLQVIERSANFWLGVVSSHSSLVKATKNEWLA